MQIDELLGRFAEVSEQPDGGFLAVCPAHNDSRPSLRIWVGEDRKVRLTDRAGCDPADIIEAAGLTWGDLFDVKGDVPTVRAERPEIVGPTHLQALNGYVSDTRERLTSGHADWAGDARDYLAERFGMDVDTAYALGVGVDDGSVAPRWASLSPAFRRYARLTVPLMDFSGVPHGLQGRDLTGDCPGRWLSLTNPEGFRWGPYGVFRGEAGYAPWIITEGPGDGLTATALGYDSVVVRGASLVNNPELLSELANGLKGRMVIVAGDSDRAGQEFNRRVTDGLSAHGIDVHALELPEGADDLTAWRESGPEGFPRAFHSAVKGAGALSAEDHFERQRASVSAELAERTGADSVSSDQGIAAGRILAQLIERYGDSDAMNAHALVAWTDGRIKFAPGLGFYVWNGRVWERSEVKVRQEIHRMGAALVMAGKLPESKGFTMTTRIDALMTELRSVPSVYVAAQDFDARPDLLSFANGTVELRTKRLRPHRKEDMLTYSLAVEYDASAKCPRWEQFLREIMPGMPDMPAYLQRLTGYGITGYTDEQAFAVLWGKGANGKSVFTDTLSDIFSAIAKTTPFATFEEKASGGIPNDIAALRAARLVMASEGESGKPMSEAVLKRVTGKDMVSARFLRQEFFEFKPTFLLLLATNHKPRFRGQDEGLWRRVKMVPFKRYFAPHERDYELDVKLRAEAQGIAAWAVQGAADWFATGLNDPAEVVNASDEYRRTSDALAGFFPGVLVEDPAATMVGGEAFNTYLEWCEAENLPQRERWTRQAFYRAMEERSITSKKTNKGIALVGIRPAEQSKPVGPGIFGKDDD
ncbi:phage/plasmid primase, P4 family [Streptomyces sp. NPDC006235]|uniref:phage/plasmid primase, P4 family n=1 Tax=Streptomyces sp. NPDC006235 TaxID=3156736 RepID=UPI0033AC8B4A